MTITEKEQKRHFQSLQAADMLAKYAKEVQLERGWSYQRSAEYARSKHPDLATLELKGFTDEQESRSYTYTSFEASKLIADGAKDIQKQKKCSYLEAVKLYYDDPKNAEVVRCYTEND
jgi:hypothetical protein